MGRDFGLEAKLEAERRRKKAKVKALIAWYTSNKFLEPKDREAMYL